MSKQITDVLPSLSLDALRDLWVNYKRAAELAKNMQETINAEILRRYTDKVRAELSARGREHGEVTINEDDASVKVEVRATIKWDSESLRRIYNDHPEARGLFKVEMSIPEKAYATVPATLKDSVDAARTVTYSEPKPSFITK